MSQNHWVARLECVLADAQAGANELGRLTWFYSISKNYGVAGVECAPAGAQAGANELGTLQTAV